MVESLYTSIGCIAIYSMRIGIQISSRMSRKLYCLQTLWWYSNEAGKL